MTRHLGSSSTRYATWDLTKHLIMTGGKLYLPKSQTDEESLCYLVWTLGISQVGHKLWLTSSPKFDSVGSSWRFFIRSRQDTSTATTSLHHRAWPTYLCTATSKNNDRRLHLRPRRSITLAGPFPL